MPVGSSAAETGQAVFETDDLSEAEAELARLYGVEIRLQTGTTPLPTRTRLAVTAAGPVTYSRHIFGFDAGYHSPPSGRLALAWVGSGALELHPTGDREPLWCGPGEVIALEAPDHPHRGVVHHCDHQLVLLDPDILTRLGDHPPGGGPVRLNGHRPRTPSAGRRVAQAIAHLGGQAHRMTDHPLLGAAAADYLAAVVLSAFPTTIDPEPAATDRRDAHPATVRRALAYIESHVRDEITVADIAAAAFVSVRALQLAFRRHLDTTPLAHLKRVRLDGAHQQLHATDPTDGHTVASIAAQWGFAHPGRFATTYHRVYGHPPAHTLHQHRPPPRAVASG